MTWSLKWRVVSKIGNFKSVKHTFQANKKKIGIKMGRVDKIKAEERAFSEYIVEKYRNESLGHKIIVDVIQIKKLPDISNLMENDINDI